MAEKIITYTNLIKVEHRLYCDKCGTEMSSGANMVLTVCPPKYQYFCKNCGYEVLHEKTYPYTELIGERLEDV